MKRSSRQNADIAAQVQTPDFYRQLLQSLPVAMYTCDSSGHLTGFNEHCVELWGRKPDVEKELWCGAWKIQDRKGRGLMPEQTPLARSIQSARSINSEELTIERPDGSLSHVVCHPRLLYSEQGELVGGVTTLVDVTQVRNSEAARDQSQDLYNKLTGSFEQEVLERTEELSRNNKLLDYMNHELSKSEERYHRMVEEVEDYAILMLSPEGTIMNWNKGAQKIKGYKESEVLGKNFSIFYLPEDQASGLPQTLITRAKSEGKATHEGWRIRKDGTRFWGSIVLTALHDAKGNVTGLTKVTRDLTERKLAEDARLEAIQELQAKNKDLEQFTYIASHDLQEPLRKIQTFSSRILESEIGLSAVNRDYFNRLQGTASRMQKLINDLLQYSRVNATERTFEPLDLNIVLQNVLNELKEDILEKGARVTSAQLPTIRGISFQFHQLFTNLISNSLKFSKASVPPLIEISSQKVNGRDLDSELADPDRSYHYLKVGDNGIGFEPQHQNRIFGLFQRLHTSPEYHGTGIGLALCKKIIENHHGFVQAESDPGKGTVFHIYLPAD